MSPIRTTSNKPSSGRASGASHIAPPCHWPFATITSCIRASRRVTSLPSRPPSSTDTSVFCHSRKTRTSAFTTSFSVPSPPTETTSVAPSRTASIASSVSCPGRSENRVSPARPSPSARCASSGQRLPVAPPADAGLTRKTVLMGRRGCEGDARHPVDGCAQLLVRYSLELALDDDVADGEHAARVHLAQRAEREQDRGLHLDPENPAVGPALILAVVRVVEDVARDDGADVERLAGLLRGVHRAVDQAPVSRGAMGLVAEVRPGRPVLRHG